MAKWGLQWVVPALLLVLGGCEVTSRDDQSGTVPSRPDVQVPPPMPSPPPEPALPPEPQSVFTGSYPDREERALRERTDKTGVQVRRSGDTIKLILPANTVFMLNSDQLQARFIPTLDVILQTLREYDKTTVNIKGFTDATGSFEHNQELSERRAKGLAGYLLQRQVAPQRVRSAGYGPRYPLAGNDSESGRAQNRRIEIDLAPLP
jgi:outer membrane protein OmpA-like peptidoglycan-associated protein